MQKNILLILLILFILGIDNIATAAVPEKSLRHKELFSINLNSNYKEGEVILHLEGRELKLTDPKDIPAHVCGLEDLTSYVENNNTITFTLINPYHPSNINDFKGEEEVKIDNSTTNKIKSQDLEKMKKYYILLKGQTACESVCGVWELDKETGLYMCHAYDKTDKVVPNINECKNYSTTKTSIANSGSGILLNRIRLFGGEGGYNVGSKNRQGKCKKKREKFGIDPSIAAQGDIFWRENRGNSCWYGIKNIGMPDSFRTAWYGDTFDNHLDDAVIGPHKVLYEYISRKVSDTYSSIPNDMCGLYSIYAEGNSGLSYDNFAFQKLLCKSMCGYLNENGTCFYSTNSSQVYQDCLNYKAEVSNIVVSIAEQQEISEAQQIDEKIEAIGYDAFKVDDNNLLKILLVDDKELINVSSNDPAYRQDLCRERLRDKYSNYSEQISKLRIVINNNNRCALYLVNFLNVENNEFYIKGKTDDAANGFFYYLIKNVDDCEAMCGIYENGICRATASKNNKVKNNCKNHILYKASE